MIANVHAKIIHNQVIIAVMNMAVNNIFFIILLITSIVF